MSTDAGQTTGGAPASTGTPASTGGAASSGVAFSWGDNWRSQIAEGSTDAEKDLARLARFESPKTIYKSFRELERARSAGELRPALSANPTPQELEQWRKDNGVPAKAEDYKITMPAGRQPPKDDDAFLKSFLTGAHKANYTQLQVDQAVSAFYAEVDRLESASTDAEKVAEQACEDQLRQEWGADYRPNKAMAEALLTRAPAGFRDRFMNGYLADRTPIRASKDAWQWLVQMEREINPAATIVPSTTGNIGQTIEAELADLKTMMKNKQGEYWKGPKAEQHQARYRQLLEAQEKLKAKAAAA